MDDEELLNKPDPKAPWFDAVCAVLMAVTTLTTAWCSYQSSRWSGESSGLDGFADKRQRETMAMHFEAQEFKSLYVRLVMEVIDARLAGNQKLEAFYVARFPADLRAAWDKWIELKPFEDPSAPPHPLVAGLFNEPFKEEIRVAKEETAKAQDRAHLAGSHASGYLSNTVLLATVLFFAGTASKFDHRRVRRGSLAFALALFVFAAVRVLILPIA